MVILKWLRDAEQDCIKMALDSLGRVEITENEDVDF